MPPRVPPQRPRRRQVRGYEWEDVWYGAIVLAIGLVLLIAVVVVFRAFVKEWGLVPVVTAITVTAAAVWFVFIWLIVWLFLVAAWLDKYEVTKR